MSKNGFDIYEELSQIETNNISSTGKVFQKVMNNRSIKGFWRQREIRDRINRKIARNNISVYNKKVDVYKQEDIDNELNKMVSTKVAKEQQKRKENMFKDFNTVMNMYFEKNKQEKIEKEELKQEQWYKQEKEKHKYGWSKEKLDSVRKY